MQELELVVPETTADDCKLKHSIDKRLVNTISRFMDGDNKC